MLVHGLRSIEPLVRHCRCVALTLCAGELDVPVCAAVPLWLHRKRTLLHATQGVCEFETSLWVLSVLLNYGCQ
jgi:hypothetical protein